MNQEVDGYKKSDDQVYGGDDFDRERFLAVGLAGKEAEIAEADIHADDQANFRDHGLLLSVNQE